MAVRSQKTHIMIHQQKPVGPKGHCPHYRNKDVSLLSDCLMFIYDLGALCKGLPQFHSIHLRNSVETDFFDLGVLFMRVKP